MDPTILAELRKGYRERLPGKIESLEQSLSALERGEPEHLEPFPEPGSRSDPQQSQ